MVISKEILKHLRVFAESVEKHKIDEAQLVSDLILQFWKAYARCNPIDGDESVIYPFEKSIDAGSEHTFEYIIPEDADAVGYFYSFGITEQTSAEYYLSVDGGSQLIDKHTFDIQDCSDHMDIFKPPIIFKDRIALRVKNGDSSAHTFKGYFALWLRGK